MNSNHTSEIPFASIEDQEVSRRSQTPPRSDLSTPNDSQRSLPRHIPPHIHSEASFSAQDNIPSAASSPSAAYSGLSIESERGGEAAVGGGPPNSGSQGNRSQSPNKSFIQRAMMGGAADAPLRSSSPLKRPASELEQGNPAKDKEDVDMEGLETSKEVSDNSNQEPSANDDTETERPEQQEPLGQGTDTSLAEADGRMLEGELVTGPILISGLLTTS